jgi:hypothetical protein
MLSVTSPRNLHAKQHLQIALMLLLLCVGQLLVVSHSHARDLLQHEDCVVCQHQGAGFDSVTATALTFEFVPFRQLAFCHCDSAPTPLPARPRARSPPIHS